MSSNSKNGLAERRSIPECTLVSVEYPGYVKDANLAIKTLGGRTKLARDIAEDIGMPVELRYRHKDPASHPINGDIVATQNLLLKVTRRVRRPKNAAARHAKKDVAEHVETNAEVVGVIEKTVRFRRLSDFQFVPQETDPLWGVAQAFQPMDIDKIKSISESDILDSDLNTATAYIPAPFLDRHGWPSQFAFMSTTRSSTQKATGAKVLNAGKEDKASASQKPKVSFHGISIKLDDPNVPMGPSPEALQNLEAVPQELFAKAKAILEKTPVVSRNAMEVFMPAEERDRRRLNIIMPTVAYLFDTGPWRSCWIRFGYDPRKDPEAYRYQILDMRRMQANDTGGRRHMKHRGWTQMSQQQQQQASERPPNPIQAQKYIYDDDAARQGMAGIFQFMYVKVQPIRDLIEYPAGRRRRPSEKSGWLHFSLIKLIRAKMRLLKKSLEGSAAAVRELRVDYAELNRMLEADRRDEDAEIAAEELVQERQASVTSGQLSQIVRTRVNAHVDELMKKLATQGAALADNNVADGDAYEDDFDEFDIFGEGSDDADYDYENDG
ncbi:tau 95 subunit of transcription factor TFIIIC [Coemansia spiralis]|uniref:Tau 95 subunit of transcription factor TFIIIC n=2 Tax=Coemansia TaxID=4863 RepID=A0A9W8GFK5_9FUNG|nr:RNA polymerase III transcription factor IIIC subunit-domain-containing protein [Coemansia spiralis]KAJ1992456.1 tau 95 subunit of transcription factor TFIIIC [Coemansia umbellata]KAJ2621785.1 tau 95 subunit of transcription factor TFIIIC [Coemansia sp. RSA 1358]KAJ2681172.1 tau 95 subunit of transcription factor TFIIIC [Coemansia spiralis]